MKFQKKEKRIKSYLIAKTYNLVKNNQINNQSQNIHLLERKILYKRIYCKNNNTNNKIPKLFILPFNQFGKRLSKKKTSKINGIFPKIYLKNH